MTWERFCENYKLPKKYRDCSVDDIGEKQELLDFLIKQPTSVLLKGEPGRGKTHFLFSLIKGLFQKRNLEEWHIRFFTGVDLEETMRELTRSYNTANAFVDNLADVPLLFIDDFGVCSIKEEAELHYYKLLDLRLNNGLATVISTNLSNDDTEKLFGKRISSRLTYCLHIPFEGPDLRTRNIPPQLEKFCEVR